MHLKNADEQIMKFLPKPDNAILRCINVPPFPKQYLIKVKSFYINIISFIYVTARLKARDSERNEVKRRTELCELSKAISYKFHISSV
jgi:hypothetical protein